MGTEEQRVFAFLNKTPAVKVSIQKQPEANTITVVDGVKQQIQELRRQSNSTDMVITPTLDESHFIRNSLADVTFCYLWSSASSTVVFGVCAANTDYFPSDSSLYSAIILKLFGLTLNVFSLAGLAVGIGQAIDTSVVILENIAVQA